MLAQDAAPGKGSDFGRYEGWSVEMSDGVRLAIDVVRLTKEGEVSVFRNAASAFGIRLPALRE